MFRSVGILLIAIGVVLAVFLQGLRRIPANPPQVALVTRFGKRILKVKKEGWRLFLGYPYIYGYILIPITRVNQDLAPEEVRTLDNALLEVPGSFTWHVDGEDSQSCIDYLNNGGEEGVRNILNDIATEEIRQWARTLPTWEEAQGATDQAIKVILGAILTVEVDENDIKDARKGKGKLKPPSMGIVIVRANIGQVELKGAAKEAADNLAKEIQERKAEIVELEHVEARIEKLVKMGFSREAALEVVQTERTVKEGERSKVPKEIRETKVNFSPETREMIMGLAPLLAGLLGRNTGNKGDEQS